MKFGILYVARHWHYSSWLVHYLAIRTMEKVLARYVGTGGLLADIGCGAKPYAGLASMHCAVHIGLDYPCADRKDCSADAFCNAHELPLKSAIAETVLSSAVLEHLEEPLTALKEAFRILKPGGVLIVSAPLFWHLHEAPRDFYRFTRYGLEYLLKASGFEVEEVMPLSGFGVTMAAMLVYYLARLNRGVLKRIPIIPAISVGIQLLGALMNRVDARSTQWSWAYIGVGRKAAPIQDLP